MENGMYPDLALLSYAEKTEICCVLLEGEGLPETLAALSPFHVSHSDGCTALLFSGGIPGGNREGLSELLTAEGLRCGLSGPFAGADSAHGGMLKARIALETGRELAPKRTVYTMEEFGDAALLRAAKDALSAEGYVADDFCEAAVGEIAAYDRQQGTSYGESLAAYLRAGRDLRRAAEALGVHRNTLSYRMNRVQSVFSLDLSDMNLCFELLFSYWLREGVGAEEETACGGAFDRRAAQEILWKSVQRLAKTDYGEEPSFACVMLAADVSQLSDEARNALLLRFAKLGGKAGVLAFDDDMAFFVCPPQRAGELEAAFAPICQQAGCRMAVTQAFAADRIPWRTTLCRRALRLGPGAVTQTRGIGSTLLFMTLERRFSLSPYLREDVLRVMDEDGLRGTALSRTLYAYLLHFCDMKRTAEQLGMHRNTIEYQLRKIDALIGETGGAERFARMCTYKMLALPRAD